MTKCGVGGVDKVWGCGTMGWDSVGTASNTWKQELANAKQPKKKKKTYTSCVGVQADAGGPAATWQREQEAGQ